MKFNILSKHNMVNRKRLQPLSICASAILACIVNYSAMADQTINDDLVVKGSICVGFDCSTGETFGFDTIRLKENNLRIKFQDTSASSSFPTRDWQITVNDSVNGGANYFRIENMDAETVPFTILDGADSNSLYIHTGKRIGIGTSAPQMQLHAVTGNSPTIRLEQDSSGGFAAQAWDLSSNETNFFLRDITNGGTLPLRISTGAPSASIFVAGDGDVGFETTTPDGLLDIAHPTDQNNHAILVSPLGYLGVNIDNGFVPYGLLDVQTTGGVSRFLVKTDGNVGIGTSTPSGRFDIKGLNGTSNYFNIDANGNIGVGTVAPNAKVEITSGDLLVRSGQLRIGEYLTTASSSGIDTLLSIKSAASQHNVMNFDTTDANTVNQMRFSSAGTVKWLWGGRNEVDAGNTNDRFTFHNGSEKEVLTLHQTGSLFLSHTTNSIGSVLTETSHQIEAESGAHLTTGGVWTNSSSRKRKKNIRDIGQQEALSALIELQPVKFEYISQPEETYSGFISEDVPELVATNDRKSLSAMDIVAVLTKVVQNQQDTIEQLNLRLEQLESQ